MKKKFQILKLMVGAITFLPIVIMAYLVLFCGVRLYEQQVRAGIVLIGVGVMLEFLLPVFAVWEDF